MKRLLLIALRECRRMASNHMYLLSMLVFPVFVTVFFTSFMHEGQPENMPVGVVDLDNTTTTRKLTRMLDSFQSSEVVAHYPSVEEARQTMQRGDIYGFLYFPKETTSKLLASRQPHVSYYYSYATLTSGALVFKDLKTVSTLGSAGVAKSVMSAKGYTDDQIMAFLQPISIDLHTVGNPWVNYNIYLSTMLVPTCLLLLMFLITAYAMGMELKENTATHSYMALGDGRIHGLHVRRAPLPPPGRLGRHRAACCAHRVRFRGLRRVHVRTAACAAHVDEPLFAVGRAQLLNGRHGVPRAGYGRSAAGSG